MKERRTHIPAWMVILSLSAVTLITFSVLVLLGLLKLPPAELVSAPDDTLVLYGLTAFNFVAFSVFAFILVRNLLRLRRERQQQRLGSHLKTKLVRSFIAVSILPLVFLAMFSYLFINRTIEKWFGTPYRAVVAESRRFADAYTQDEIGDLRQTVRMLRRLVEGGLVSDSMGAVTERLEAERENSKLLAIEVVTPTSSPSQGEWSPAVREGLEAARASVLGGREFARSLGDGEGRQVLVVGVPFESLVGGLVVLSRMPSDVAELSANLARQQEAYERLYREQGRVRRVTLQVLGVITFLLLFAATWMAIYLAKGITEPIQALAEATEKVARGDFSGQVECWAEDELAMLVASFNKMIADLRESRHRLEESARQMSEINRTLDERRRYIETVLESLSTGVLSLDMGGRVTTINPAARRILQIEDAPVSAVPGAEVFAPLLGEHNRAAVARLIRRALRTGGAVGELELQTSEGVMHLVVTVSALRDEAGAAQGVVVMFEDITELVKAQRQAVWSEVARRMAHEIKNPLTPIQLSAERIARNIHREDFSLADERCRRLLDECTTTIMGEVHTLQRLVDEFARFARLPEARLVEGSLHEVVMATAKLYQDRLNGVVMETRMAPDVPPVKLDREQMKQALVNLIENALHALEGVSGERRILLSTDYQPEQEVVRLTVADTGHGISPEDKGRLFTPYFSKKEGGTGLGLAIVHRIVTEHHGRIRVEDHRPRGARFIIELPASEARASATPPRQETGIVS
jgi:PAS domain S-box-containing protein